MIMVTKIGIIFNTIKGSQNFFYFCVIFLLSCSSNGQKKVLKR